MSTEMACDCDGLKFGEFERVDEPPRLPVDVRLMDPAEPVDADRSAAVGVDIVAEGTEISAN